MPDSHAQMLDKENATQAHQIFLCRYIIHKAHNVSAASVPLECSQWINLFLYQEK